MKRILVLPVIVILMLCSCMQARRIEVLQMPDLSETQLTPVEVAAFLEKYAGNDAVYLKYERVVEHSGNKDNVNASLLGLLAPADWTYSHLHRSRKLIINPEAPELTTIEFPHRKPKKLYMRVIAPDGQVKTFGLKDLVKFDQGKRSDTYKFIYPNIQKGTIIDIGYEYVYSVRGYPPPLEEEFALQFAIPCEALSVRYIYPNWWSVVVKRLGLQKGVPVEHISDAVNKKEIISYTGRNVPALKPELYAPYFKDVAMYMSLQVTRLEMAGTKWNRAISWNEQVENFREGTLKKSGKRSKVMEKLVDSLIAGCENDYEKMNAINHYLVNTIENSWVFNDGNLTKIIESGKGNAFEITSLAEKMLSRAGISSRYLLVHDASEGYFDVEFVNLMQFSLPALHVELDSIDYVLFPYIERLPANVILPPAQGQRALVVAEDIDVMEWTVPSVDPLEHPEEHVCTVTIDTTGMVSATDIRRLHGIEAYNMREQMHDLTEEELRDSLLELVTYPGVVTTLDSFTVLHKDEYGVPLEISLYYALDNSVAFAGEDAILQTAGLLAPVAYIVPQIDSAERTNPIAIHYDLSLRRHLQIVYPSDWNIVTPLEDVDFGNQFGSVKGNYVSEEGRLTVEQELLLRKSSGPKETAGDLAALLGATPKTWVPSVVFRKGQLEQP